MVYGTEHRASKVREIFFHLVELPEQERMHRLDELCSQDSSLSDIRSEINKLLKYDAAEPLDVSPSSYLVGRTFGNYRITQFLGQGGMGVVYKAERKEGPIQRSVAIKLLSSDLKSEGILRRFKQEQQVLASLNHPLIAQIFDGGTTKEGQPYFVMEYVEGEPIDLYCQRNQLTLNQRLALFTKVAKAVQYAHRNLVVHRDLKPSNILVTQDGNIKLLDFGIAKLLPSNTVRRIVETRSIERLMTPRYAAPEQIKGDNITTATDIYQLGVILYHLLCNRWPYPIRKNSTYEIEKSICEVEPIPPSIAISLPASIGVVEGASDGNTYAETKHLQKRLRGDLDAIVLKALRKESEKRYSSVEAFIDDIKQFLNVRPVRASRGNTQYRIKKFIYRNRLKVAVFALFVFMVASYTATVSVQAKRIQTEAEKSKRVSNFLIELFELSDPYLATREDLSARKLLEQSTKKIEYELSDQPETKAELMTVLGRINNHIGDYQSSKELLYDALEIRRTLPNISTEDKVTTINELAKALSEIGHYAEARSFFEEALSLVRHDRNSIVIYAEILNNFAVLNHREGNDLEAEQLYRASLEIQESLKHSSDLYKWDESEYDHPNIATAKSNLALILRSQGRFSEAEFHLREALAMRQRLYGTEHWFVPTTQSILASVLTDLEQYEDADSLFKVSLTMKESLLGSDHPHVAATLSDFGYLLQQTGQLDEAESHYRRALHIRKKSYGEMHNSVATAYYMLGVLLQQKGSYHKAEQAYARLIDIDKKVLGNAHPAVAQDIGQLASLYFDMGRLGEADSLYVQAIDRLVAQTPLPMYLATALVGRSKVLISKKTPLLAEPLLQEALKMREKAYPKGHGKIGEVLIILGVCLTKLNRLEEAEEVLLQGSANLNHRDEEDPYKKIAYETLNQLYEQIGKPKEGLTHTNKTN